MTAFALVLVGALALAVLVPFAIFAATLVGTVLHVVVSIVAAVVSAVTNRSRS